MIAPASFSSMRLYILLTVALLAAGCSGNTNTSGPNAAENGNKPANVNKAQPVIVSTYEIVKTYPHDPKAFTQGLVYRDGFIYEGTGGDEDNDDPFFSSLRKVELETGKVVQKHDIPREYFGEGITILNDQVYQLTWKEMTGFVYDLKDFRLLREVRYAGQGWGLTNDGTHLIMSDGTHVLRFINPEDFKTVRTLVVNDERGKPIPQLNELELIKGEIWANVWQTGWIVRIDPATGRLIGRIDLGDLVEDEQRKNRKADVLNGIAYDEAADRIFVTGKLWNRLLEIKVKPKQ
jgi:glutamine cyclotransferase